MTLWLRQFRLCLIWNISFVLLLWKVFVDMICLQHWLFARLRQAELAPIVGVFFGMIFLFFDRCVCPIRSRKFLLRRNAITGFSAKEDAIFGLVCSRCQCLFIAEVIFGKFLLKVVVKGMRLPDVLSFSSKRVRLFTASAFFRCSSSFFSGYLFE